MAALGLRVGIGRSALVPELPGRDAVALHLRVQRRVVGPEQAGGLAVGRGERNMMTCEEADVLLHALLDGELDAGHAREVDAHATTCRRCASALAELRHGKRSVGIETFKRLLHRG